MKKAAEVDKNDSHRSNRRGKQEINLKVKMYNVQYKY